VQQPWTKQGKSNIELCTSIPERFGERRARSGYYGVGAGFGGVSEIEGGVLEGLLVAGAYDSIGPAGLEFWCGSGDGLNLDGVVRVKCPLDFRGDAELVLKGRRLQGGLHEVDREGGHEGDYDPCFHVRVWLIGLSNR